MSQSGALSERLPRDTLGRVPIEWYPGHMVTARKEAALAMRKTDVVLEVLDARVPFSSCNPLVESLRRQNQRPALKILNKADIADPERTRQWLAYYDAQPGVQAIAVSAKQTAAVKRIPERALALAPHRAKPGKPLRLMILGIPNVGKSTLMNTLLRRSVTKVGDVPAVTKSHLGHELGKDMWLVDTPGMLWPGVEATAAVKLAATHSIGQNAYDPVEVAADLAQYLALDYDEFLQQRYGAMPAGASGYELLDCVARSRSLLIKGGAADRERAARTLLGEFRAGTLGRISLETPEQVAQRPPKPA
ncbi:MAG TPA: ribosome biogenesis GTPase YlqF [Polyangiaceae bacterium]|nr:ribosome biogenesis GTPase YlqF [Polyangiaceae bacterium]